MTDTTDAQMGNPAADARIQLANAVAHRAPNLQTVLLTVERNVAISAQLLHEIATAGDGSDTARFLEIVNWAIGIRDVTVNRLTAEGVQLTANIEHLTETVTNLNTTTTTLQAEKTALRAEKDNLTVELGSTLITLRDAVAGGGGGGDKSTSLPHPEKFTGEDSSTEKRTTRFQAWESQVADRWAMQPREFDKEYKKILYIGAMLSGAAHASVYDGMKKVRENRETPTEWEWPTAEALLTELRTRYMTYDTVTGALSKLGRLKQEGQWAKWADFITEYTRLTAMCKYDKASRVRELRRKMSKGMKDAVKVQLTLPEDDDWEGWVKACQTLATNAERTEDHQGVTQGGHNGGGNKNKDPDAMDLDAIQMSRMSDYERQRRLAEGLCLKCGQAGHVVKYCKNPRNNGSNREGRGGRGQRGGRGGGYHNGGNYGYNQQQNGGYQGGHQGGFQGSHQSYGYQNNGGNRQGYNQQPQGQRQSFYNQQPQGRGGHAPGQQQQRGGGYQVRQVHFPDEQGGENYTYMDLPQPGFVVGEGTQSVDSQEQGNGNPL